jgi:hypothetical protein
MNAQKRADKLEDELLQLFAEIDATTYVALKKIAELDGFEGFAKIGFQSTAHWLHFRVGLSMGTAREHVRVANSLTKLPRLSAAMKRGGLSYSKVRALTRIATPETEAHLLDMANDGTASQMEKLVRKVRMVERSEAEQQVESRALTVGFDETGMFFIRGTLMADEGARVMAALARHKSENQADAFMAALSSRETTELIVHVEANDAACQVESVRGDRVSVSKETARRAACDASVVTMTHDSRGNVLNVGRKTRKIPIALKRALAERDAGCRYPGCPNRRVDAHHIQHWADGGETSLSNLVQLCRFHHRLLHEGRYTIEAGTFIDNRGRAIDACGEPIFAQRVPKPDLTIWKGPTWWWRHADYGLAVSGLLAASHASDLSGG